MSVLVGLMSVALGVALPGVLLVRLLADGDPLWRWTLGLGVGLFAAPALAFGVAVAAGTHVTAGLVTALGVAVSAGLGLALRSR